MKQVSIGVIATTLGLVSLTGSGCLFSNSSPSAPGQANPNPRSERDPSSSTSGTSGDPVASSKTPSCDKFIASLPKDYSYGWVKSPEEPGNPSSPSLRIFYYYPSRLRGKTTLFLNGGPGGSSHGNQVTMDAALREFSLEGKVSFVFMDQRGTGCSSGYPEDGTDAKVLERARWYGSRGIVSDAELVRQTLLGDHSWSVLGQSYGAYVVHRYAILHPESLEKALAYANTINTDAMERMRSRIGSQFSTWESYFAVYPDDRARLQLLLNEITPKSCAGADGRQTICGYRMIDPLVSQSLGFLTSWPSMHDALVAMAGNGTSMNDAQWDAVRKYALMNYPYRTHWQNVSLAAIDYYDRNILPLDYPTCQAISDEFEKTNPKVSFASYLTECSAAMELRSNDSFYRAAQDHFGEREDRLKLEDFKQALEGGARGKFYLYSAEIDPYVPAVSFGEEVSAVGDLLVYRNFFDAGHEGFRTEQPVFTDLVN